jgi:hypothetical protein
MPLLESILTLYGTALGTASGLKDLHDFLEGRLQVEDVVADLIQDGFQRHLPRLEHLCPKGKPTFDKQLFKACLSSGNLVLRKADDLPDALLIPLRSAVQTPGATCGESEFDPIFRSILMSASRGLWNRLAQAPAATRQIELEQSEAILKQTGDIAAEQALSAHELKVLGNKLDALLTSFAEFSKAAWKNYYDQLTDAAPPSEHKIDNTTYENPFLLARAEDFNHNYSKLAKLFQSSIEWESLQRRTDNVFLEGGRGTGKSMLLRRLTAQTVIAANRLSQANITFESLKEDYFGIYVKLTRGYYEQFTALDQIPQAVGELFAQHELNMEVADVFVETLRWLLRERCLPSVEGRLPLLLDDMNRLFPKAPAARSLDEFQTTVLKFEQDQMHSYYREKAFGNSIAYSGSAEQTVTFLRNLSRIFRSRLFPEREMRLFLLIDEFETLLPIQQKAVNTVMKMRLPDLTLKIGVRKAGRRTHDTFTAGDPIQDPRDYTEIRLDYDGDSTDYTNLLRGIAEKRLAVANYPTTDIGKYLPGQSWAEEVKPEELEAELDLMWQSGKRRTARPNHSFKNHATAAAIYRILAKKKARKGFSGFDQYALLSSGVVSNYIELCKYAFFFALSDELPLKVNPAIPSYLQTNAAYSVSERLFDTIDGNVPAIGGVLKQLVRDLGDMLRNRLLNHPSEPEANRFEISDYSTLSATENKEIAQIIDGAVVWSVLHLEGVSQAFRPRNTARPSEAQLIINRIYAPILGFSPRSRWRVKISVRDLKALTQQERRIAVYQRLMKSIGFEEEDSTQPDLLTSVTERHLPATHDTAEELTFAQTSEPDAYVSYAWGEDTTPEGKAREEIVNRLCDAVRASGRSIGRDKDRLTAGDSIERFAHEISKAQRIIAVISTKSLHSPYCMAHELFRAYRRCDYQRVEFQQKVIALVTDDARDFFRDDLAVVELAKKWKEKHEKFRAELEAVDPTRKSSAKWIFVDMIEDMCPRLPDMLDALKDIIMPRGFDDIYANNFREVLDRLSPSQSSRTK